MLMIFREQVIVFEQAGALPRGALEDVLAQVRKLDMAEVMARRPALRGPGWTATGSDQ